MMDHWEFALLGFVFGVWAVFGVSYVVLLWQLSPWRHVNYQDPIYGPADPGRTNGPHAKPNLRVV